MNPFKLERYFAEFEFSAKHLLSSSDCEPLVLNEMLEMADEESLHLWNNLKLAYTESMGLPLLREEIASMYEGVNPENVIIAGPQEGIFLAMNTTLSVGDEVVVTFPGYQSLYEVALNKNCKVDFWKPDLNHRFHLEQLEELLTPRTKMLVINFPHNPTGALITQEEFKRIILLCEKNDIILFSDEMYRNLEYHQADRLPSVAEAYSNSITLCGMSKSFALPGLRLGWLVIKNPDRLSAIQAYKDYTSICPPAPSEILALIALRNKKEIYDRNMMIIQGNNKLMQEFAGKNQDTIRWIAPKAGSIAFPELLLDKDIEHFCRCLNKRTGIMLLPGSVYNYPGNYFRIGLGRRDFSNGLAEFGKFLKN